MFAAENTGPALTALEAVRPVADAHGATLAQTVINWTFSSPGVTGAIVGARRPEQAIENAGAMAFELADDERRLISDSFVEAERHFDALKVKSKRKYDKTRRKLAPGEKRYI